MAKTKGSKGGGGRPSETKQISLRAGNQPPTKPKEVSGRYASELWDLAIAALPHVLREIDGPVLSLACLTYERAMECFEKIGGDPDEDERLHKQAVSAITKFETLARSLGLNPHARRVIKPAADEVDTDREDPMMEWLKRGGLN
jgi:phage terminase small subunit